MSLAAPTLHAPGQRWLQHLVGLNRVRQRSPGTPGAARGARTVSVRVFAGFVRGSRIAASAGLIKLSDGSPVTSRLTWCSSLLCSGFSGAAGSADGVSCQQSSGNSPSFSPEQLLAPIGDSSTSCEHTSRGPRFTTGAKTSASLAGLEFRSSGSNTGRQERAVLRIPRPQCAHSQWVCELPHQPWPLLRYQRNRSRQKVTRVGL